MNSPCGPFDWNATPRPTVIAYLRGINAAGWLEVRSTVEPFHLRPPTSSPGGFRVSIETRSTDKLTPECSVRGESEGFYRAIRNSRLRRERKIEAVLGKVVLGKS